HTRHLERVLEELIVDVGSSHDQGAMPATKEARSSPRPFTTRSAVRSLAARSDRVASPVSVSTAVKPLSFAMRTSVYNLSPTNVTGGPVVAPDHRRSLMVSAMAVLGFPSTVGVRPVAAAKSAANDPQSGIGPSGMGHTRSGWVA